MILQKTFDSFVRDGLPSNGWTLTQELLSGASSLRELGSLQSVCMGSFVSFATLRWHSALGGDAIQVHVANVDWQEFLPTDYDHQKATSLLFVVLGGWLDPHLPWIPWHTALWPNKDIPPLAPLLVSGLSLKLGNSQRAGMQLCQTHAQIVSDLIFVETAEVIPFWTPHEFQRLHSLRQSHLPFKLLAHSGWAKLWLRLQILNFSCDTENMILSNSMITTLERISRNSTCQMRRLLCKPHHFFWQRFVVVI